MAQHPGVGIAIRAAVVLLAIITAYYVLSFLIPLVYPFLIGWVIALLIQPPVHFLERRLRLPRWLGVFLILFLFVGSIITGLLILIAQMVLELTHLAQRLPGYLQYFNQYIVNILTKDTQLSHIIDNVQKYLQRNPEHKAQIISSIQRNMDVLANKGTEMITNFISGVGSFLSDLPYIATVIVFIVLAAFFIGIDWPQLRKRMLGLIPNHARKTGGIILRDLRHALFGFVRAQFTLITITATIILIGLMILGVDYALTIALIVLLLDLLPYIGVGSILVPWSIYLLLIGDYHLGLGIAILYGIIVIVRQLMEPKLVASNVGLDPLPTLIALFVGLKLFGFIGVIIGPVTVVILMALYRAGVLGDIWRFILHGFKVECE
ncbi:sporulation integral membrane protein YtvI [Polycladomyces subterraneus]|uniref:Sporulation integral membrane protein YtvI n=1 Tax=Polycladomyces subterraneus TaxID=1016997 RepID=A0ABT8IJH7_9BACL|nr:sporulation integral membrane protein YtvI [Polycladomyces subterraneus]MDN4592940.1 sporulation integral membrane protein YtvI [Polycladomyces subterraneus]